MAATIDVRERFASETSRGWLPDRPCSFVERPRRRLPACTPLRRDVQYNITVSLGGDESIAYVDVSSYDPALPVSVDNSPQWGGFAIDLAEKMLDHVAKQYEKLDDSSRLRYNPDLVLQADLEAALERLGRGGEPLAHLAVGAGTMYAAALRRAAHDDSTGCSCFPFGVAPACRASADRGHPAHPVRPAHPRRAVHDAHPLLRHGRRRQVQLPGP